MFLAIAVDNLATAQELTAEQEEAEALAREQKEKSVAKEANMFLPAQLMNPPQVTVTETAANPNDKTTGKAAPNAAANKTTKPAANTPANKTVTNTANNQVAKPAPVVQNYPPPSPKNKKENPSNVDMMFNRKVDLDYIPGLDDADMKVILPGKFEASLANAPVEEIIEEKKEEKKPEKEENKDPDEFDESGPRPMVPYSSMFIFGTENW